MKMSVKADSRNAKVFDKPRAAFIRAAQGAVKDAAAEAVRQGRAQIAAAGFPAPRWQRGLRSKFLKGPRDKPARLVFLKGLVTVFERGATISGKPLLWIPIGERRKPRGKLVSATIGGKPFLFAPGDPKKALFVGVRQVKIRKRLRVMEIVRRVAARLPEFLKRRLQALKGK